MPEGPFHLECYRRLDPLDTHDWLAGKRQGLRKIQTTCHLGTPTGYPTDGPSTSGGSTVSASAPTSLACGPWTYPSFGQSIGVTEILGRQPGLDAVDDTRYAWTHTKAQRRAFNLGPVVARLTPFGDWTAAKPVTRCSPFNTGHSLVGGFAFTPPNYDLLAQLRGKGQRCGPTGTGYFNLVPGTEVVFGPPGRNGKPVTSVSLTGGDGPAIVAKTYDALGGVTSTTQLYPLPASTQGNPQGYLQGFNLAQDPSSPSITNISGSTARDTTNTYDISLNSGPYAVDYLSTGGPLKNDALLNTDLGSITATVTNNSPGGQTQNAKAVLTGSLLAQLPAPRSLTGTIDFPAVSGSANAVAAVTLTGHSTKFTTEVAFGDLIGNTTVGYYKVVDIVSDTSIVVFDALLLAATHNGQTCNLYECPTLQAGASPSRFIISLAANGLTAWTSNWLNNGTSTSGLSVIVGQPTAFTQHSIGTTYNLCSWIYLWARRTTGGTSTLSWSTQRTTPYTPATLSGYSIWRRIAVIPISSDNFMIPLTQINMGAARIYHYERDVNASPSALAIILSGGGGSATYTKVSAAACIPPVSTAGRFLAVIVNPSAQVFFHLRCAGAFNLDTNGARARFATAMAGGASTALVEINTDATQHIECQGSVNANNPYAIYCEGYIDLP
jgi:hypothetical protein